MSTSILWTIPKSHVKARLKLVLPLLLVSIAGAFFAKELFEAVAIVVVFGGLLVGATTYAFVARDRHYELREDGFIETVAGRAPRWRPWTEFAGFQTQTEAMSRRVSGIAAAARDELGETYLLRGKGWWGLGASLPTVPETTSFVRAALERNLPHRRGAHVNGPVLLMVLAILATISVVVITRIVNENG